MRNTNEMEKTKNIENYVGAHDCAQKMIKNCRGRACSAPKGITLIALIITIIVMLILVAVTITMAVNGGLFEYAGKAVGDTQNAIDKEQQLGEGKIQIDNTWYDSMEDYIDGYSTGSTKPYSKTEKDENDCVTVNATYESDGLTAIIPAGFKISTEEDERSIKKGLVIKDAAGNEFVWVPCTTDVNDTSGVTLYAKDTRYNDGTIASKQWEYKAYSDWTDDGPDITSVSKYGGFYVGRYEAGIPSDAPFFGNTDGATYTTGRDTSEYIPVSKPNNPSWNYIKQANAKIVSEKMYANSGSVKSNLIDSYAWDTIVNWMESEKEGIALDSTNYGNYLNSTISLTDVLYATHKKQNGKNNVATQYKKGTLAITPRSGSEYELYEIATGSAECANILNIYDMAGNMREYTTEKGYRGAGSDGVQYFVYRGGDYLSALGNTYPLASRETGESSVVDVRTGFRVVLYLK